MRILKWLAALTAIAAVLVLLLAPGIVERQANTVVPHSAWPVSAPTLALHRALTIVDLHADTLLWQRNLRDASDQGQVDLTRLEKGNVALQVFSSVTKTPRDQNYDHNSGDTDNITLLAIGQLQPLRTWRSLLERSLWHAEKLRRAEAASDGRLRIVRSAADLDRLLADRARGKRVTGALLSVEGLHNLEGRAANLDVLYDAGFRMAGLAHFFDNALAGSMHGEQQGGLTPFGRDIIRAMEARGMIVDVAHASHASIAGILAFARRPVVASHTGVKATCDRNRNLSDDEIRAIAANGGLIGIGYWEEAVCATTPAATARAIKHVRDLVGVQHAALGSDFDGAVATGFDTSELAAVTEALVDLGFSDAEIAAVMGGNAVRLLRQGLPPG